MRGLGVRLLPFLLFVEAGESFGLLLHFRHLMCLLAVAHSFGECLSRGLHRQLRGRKEMLARDGELRRRHAEQARTLNAATVATKQRRANMMKDSAR